PVCNCQSYNENLADITKGKYYAELQRWAAGAASWSKPFFFLPCVEANGNWQPWSPGHNGNTVEGFVEFWRYFHDICETEGANNISWTWTMNVDPNGRYTPYADLYPGDDCVDWLGLDGYNKGVTTSNWRSFDTIFQSSYINISALSPNKPIMITQIGCAEKGGNKGNWITDCLNSVITDYPKIKAFCWFNWYFTETVMGVTGKSPYEIESSKGSQSNFKNSIANPAYIPAGELPTSTRVPVP